MGIGPGRYEIRVQGELGADWSEWLSGMEVLPDSAGETTISGVVPDQAALHGILSRIRDLNLTLVSVRRVHDENE
jgi:hypothetical protein